MKVLVINAGSSSLKYQLIDMAGERVIAKGVCERIGESGVITHKANGQSETREIPFPTHKEAIDACVSALTEGAGKVIDSVGEISAVGHRIVQGGDVFHRSCLVDDDVMRGIERLSALAPLHNPANLLGIRACRAVLGEAVPQAVVFDTAFHQTVPAVAYTYAIPFELAEKYGIRKYGFHGTSHRFVSGRCAELLGGQNTKIITCHLGNGCSVAAVENGRCVDTSMGFTPLDGLVMGTRSGSVDPSAVTFLQKKEGLSPEETDTLLNRRSGLLGVSGVSNDSRDVEAAAKAGNARAALAMEMQAYGIVKTVGSYIAVMGGADAVVFTGGIGENNPGLRAYVCRKLNYMGLVLDPEKNAARGAETEISAPGSALRAFVIPTNEELVIARDTAALAEGRSV